MSLHVLCSANDTASVGNATLVYHCSTCATSSGVTLMSTHHAQAFISFHIPVYFADPFFLLVFSVSSVPLLGL